MMYLDPQYTLRAAASSTELLMLMYCTHVTASLSAESPSGAQDAPHGGAGCTAAAPLIGQEQTDPWWNVYV